MKGTFNNIALIFGVAGLFVMLFAPARVPAQVTPGQIVNSGTVVSEKTNVQLQLPPPKSTTFKTPPDQPPVKPVKPRVLLDPPVDPSARAEDIRPMNAETVVNVKAGKTVPDNLLVPGTFTAFRNTSLANAPVVAVPGGGTVTLNAITPIEPSVANNGRVVTYTTNSYAAFSGDSGQTFTYQNPFDIFPNDGTNDPIDGGFGGDQYFFYERTRGLMFWLIQYRHNGTVNRQRLCVTRTPNETINSGCAFFVDFTTAFFNIPTPAGAAGTWLDFPDLAVSDGFLYLSSNVFCTSGCSGNQNIGAVLWRIPLNQLAQQTGSFDTQFYYEAALSSFRLTQGARGTMYWGSHITTALLRIYRWADNSGSFTFSDITHAPYNLPPNPCTPMNPPPQCGMLAISPDGRNFASFADSRIQGAWVAAGVIGFMFDAAQGGSFPFPHVQVLRFNENSNALLSQGQIFSNAHAFLYPSVQPNARGHLGGTMAWGGGAFFPSALAWIADDFNNNVITPLETINIATGGMGPALNRWGDYFATRIHSPYENTWIGTAYVLQAGNVREPHYTWFGRERDTPPATNTIYVDRLNTTGFEDGTAARPYNTVTEASFAASPGDTIIIRGGNYNEAVQFNKLVTVRNESGTAVIGRP